MTKIRQSVVYCLHCMGDGGLKLPKEYAGLHTCFLQCFTAHCIYVIGLRFTYKNDIC